MTTVPEMVTTPPRKNWAAKIQIHGILHKKPFGHQSNKWSKRYFLIRDSFLVYYPEQEKKEFEKREFFNVHPKGVIPLGECGFMATQDSAHPFCIHIDSQEFDGSLVVAAETQFERDRWLEVMERARRVTWQNTHLSNEMIRQLENDGLIMAREMQDYCDRLQTEANALSEERIRADELEKVNAELENEKQKLEKFTSDIQDEYERLRVELEDTILQMRDVADEKADLSEVLQEQSQHLSALEADKEKVLKELQKREELESQLSQENMQLTETSEDLRQRLQQIEKQTETIQTEKKQAQEKLSDNQERLLQLEEEKALMDDLAQELNSTIQDLKSQKEMTEKELREEIRARMSAEERLRNAERSLKQLEFAVQKQMPNVEEGVKEELRLSVKELKQFFEDLATESKISSQNPLIMRNTLTARKSIVRRSKTFKARMSCLSADERRDRRPPKPLRRAVTSVTPASRKLHDQPETLAEEPIAEEPLKPVPREQNSSFC